MLLYAAVDNPHTTENVSKGGSSSSFYFCGRWCTTPGPGLPCTTPLVSRFGNQLDQIRASIADCKILPNVSVRVAK